MKHNFACPVKDCNFVGTQEDSEVHQREVHPEPTFDDGWTDEEIWGEKDTQRLHDDTVQSIRPPFRSEQELPQSIAGIADDGNRVSSARTAPMRAEIGQTRARLGASVEAGSEVHNGTTLDALGDSVSRAFERAEFMKQFNAELDEEITDALPEIERYRDQLKR